MGRADKPTKDTIDNIRSFQIRDADREGYGSFYYAYVSLGTPVDEIMEIACAIVNTDKNNSLSRQEWYSTIKVVELDEKFIKLDKPTESGKTHRMHTQTKRGGLKFTLERSRLKVKYADGSVSVSE